MSVSNRNACRGTNQSVGGTQGGASWMNRGVCQACGKHVRLTSTGRIYRHLARPEPREEKR